MYLKLLAIMYRIPTIKTNKSHEIISSRNEYYAMSNVVGSFRKKRPWVTINHA